MKQLIVRVTPKQHKAMKSIAKKKGTTVADLVRQFVERTTKVPA